MKFLKLIFTVCLCTSALLGDYIVFQSKFSNSFAFRAVADSSVHAAVGFFSSLLFFSREPILTNSTNVYNVLLCTAVSSIIDIDHFFVARSVFLKDLIGLKQRGLLHCTSFWLLLTTILLACCYIFKRINTYVTTWMLIIAFISHHIRDANRRGFWMYPFGHTAPLSKHVYVTLLATLPHVFYMMCAYMKPVLDKPLDYVTII